jgi:2-succinyl-5-enolpyruvyl-6-hydroxy-3-cyclohexene-1-carboxylate synthase
VTTSDETARYCADLVSGLADAGVDTVFISPGSRNTPLTIAFAREPRITDISFRDERSAGFAALGYGKAAGRPAAVLCTSGSAATHYFPAVVEADQSAAPLVVLTADRPAHLRGTGAPQTMDQMNLYGRHVKSFTDLDVRSAQGRSDGAIIATLSSALPRGPVHANVAFDEPLLPSELPLVPEPRERAQPDTQDGMHGDLIESLMGRDVMIIAAGRQRPGFPAALNSVATALGAPILSDPQCWVTGPNTVAFGDLLASSTTALETAPPDVVLRIGPLPTSKPLWSWLETSGVSQIIVDKSRLRDPLQSAETVIDGDPTSFLLRHVPSARHNTRFLDLWTAMDAACTISVSEALDDATFPNEPEIARTLIKTLRAGELVHLGSSMPIRDVDSFATPRSDIGVLANRGVNGIDGTISTAIGAALADGPVTLLVGDVAALHDCTALAEAARLGVPLRVVVVNNDGGGIFSFLPQATSDLVPGSTYERHWGTPHGLSLLDIARGFGVGGGPVDTLADYVTAVSEPITGPEVIELRTDRTANTALHRELRVAVRAGGH